MRALVLVLLSLVIAPRTLAQKEAASAALSAAVMGGGIHALSRAHYQNFLKSELEDWKDSATGMTTKLFNQCGVSFELRAMGNRRSNFIYFVIANETEKDLVLKPNEINAEYSSGRLRRLKTPFRTNDLEIKKNWVIRGIFNLYDKVEFKNLDSIDVKIPLYLGNASKEYCVLEGTLSRNKKVPQDPDTYIRSLTFDLALKYGPNIVSSGEAKGYYENKGVFGLDIDMYFWRKHGIHLGFLRADMHQRNIDEFKEETESDDVKLSEFYTMVGYAGHHQHNSKWFSFWNLGLGNYSLENIAPVKDGNVKKVIEQSQTSYYATYELGYSFFSEEQGIWNGDYLVGAALMYRMIPEFEVGDIEMSGSNVSLLFSFRMGY